MNDVLSLAVRRAKITPSISIGEQQAKAENARLREEISVEKKNSEILKWRIRALEIEIDHLIQGSVNPNPIPDRKPSPLTSGITVDRVKRAVCALYGLSEIELRSAQRSARIVKPRQIAMYICATHGMKTSSYLGNVFGGRDHSTVIHAIQRVAHLRQYDGDFDLELRELERKLGVYHDLPFAPVSAISEQPVLQHQDGTVAIAGLPKVADRGRLGTQTAEAEANAGVSNNRISV